MKFWICTLFTLLILVALPGITQVVWFDQTQISTVTIARSETMPGLHIYEFTSLMVFQGRTEASPNTPVTAKTRDGNPSNIKLVDESDKITSQFTPMNLGNIDQFTPLAFTPLK